MYAGSGQQIIFSPTSYLPVCIHGLLFPTRNSFILNFASLGLSLIFYLLRLDPHRLKYINYAI
jgi:hypothetical protein